MFNIKHSLLQSAPLPLLCFLYIQVFSRLQIFLSYIISSLSLESKYFGREQSISTSLESFQSLNKCPFVFVFAVKFNLNNHATYSRKWVLILIAIRIHLLILQLSAIFRDELARNKTPYSYVGNDDNHNRYNYLNHPSLHINAYVLNHKRTYRGNFYQHIKCKQSNIPLYQK